MGAAAAAALDGPGWPALTPSCLTGACSRTASGRPSPVASAAAGAAGALAGAWHGGGGGSAGAAMRAPVLAALPRTADRLTVWPADSCLKSSSEMVSRSAGRPDALAALTCRRQNRQLVSDTATSASHQVWG